MGLGPVAMGVFMGVLALLLIGVFAAAWLRDKRRSNAVSDDNERIEPGPGQSRPKPLT